MAAPIVFEPDVAARFWAKVDRSGGRKACWPWTASRNKQGYGRFDASRIRAVSRHRYQAHRVAWALSVGPVPDGLHVCHHCDNPPCCNPAHLFLGTDRDNAADRDAKGRFRLGRRYSGDAHPLRRQPERAARGEQLPQTKLSAAQVQTIRDRHAAGGTTYRALAKAYGVSETTISRTVRGQTHRPAGAANKAGIPSGRTGARCP